jgi:hypothetical protein
MPGQHTDEILRTHPGCSDKEMATLQAEAKIAVDHEFENPQKKKGMDVMHVVWVREKRRGIGTGGLE